MKKYKRWLLGIALSLLLAILCVGFVPFLRSMAVMRIYSRMEENDSLLEDKGIRVHMPGGKGWYPFVMTFQDDDGFSRWSGAERRLTILYNFPAFSGWFGRTRGMDPDSPYYNGFYGAYAVSNADGTPYGFLKDGSPDPEEIGAVPQYDLSRLVLEDFGIAAEEVVFEWKIVDLQEDISIAGLDGWTRVEAEMTVSGMYHTRKEWTASYLQYGEPETGKAVEDFAPEAMRGRVYARYLPDRNVSLFLYILASNAEVLEDTDRALLQKTKIKMVDFSS